MLPKSIRGRAISLALLTTFIVVTLLSAVAHATVTRFAIESTKQVVTTHLDDVAALFTEPTNQKFDFLLGEALEPSAPVFLSVVDANNKEIGRSGNTPPRVNPCKSSRDYIKEVRAMQFGGNTYRLCAATSTEPVDIADSMILFTALIVLPLALIGVSLATSLSISRALTSVEDLRRQAEDLPLGTPQLAVVPTGDEVERLGKTLNGLLDRLAAQARATRQFVDDAGHELRNPLATMRLELEFNGAQADHATLLSQVDRLQTLVDELLSLAQADAEAINRAPVDLRALVESEVAQIQGESDLDVSADLVPSQLLGNDRLLRSAVSNLMNNALRHAATKITVTLRQVGDKNIITVVDDGNGIQAADVDRIFGRFTRLDEARTRDAGGAGLGLAIVRAVAQAHGGRAFAEPGPGGRFTVELPRMD